MVFPFMLTIALEAAAPIERFLQSRNHPQYGDPVIASSLKADFNEDGTEDHALLYWYQQSTGNPAPMEHSVFFVVWLGEGSGNFWQTGPHPIGKVGAWFPDTLKFEQGVVVVSGAQWGPGDFACCPSREDSSEYKFSPGPGYGFKVGKRIRSLQ